MTVPEFLEARRSIRAFVAEPVPRAVLDGFVEAACIAPAPHHSRPWRWVVVDTADAKQRLADGMGERWRRDLEGDGVSRPSASTSWSARRTRKITSAPALVLGCLTWDGSRPLPRRAAPARRVGHGAAVARRRGRELHARDRRLPASRRAGSPRRSSAPRRRATRSISPASGSPMRWSSSGVPIPRTSAVRARPYPSTTCAPTADPVQPGMQPASSGLPETRC